MDWLERMKKRKPFLVCAWAIGALLALGGVAGAINSLIDLFNRDWLGNAGGWYAAATGWLDSDLMIPVWFGLFNMALITVLAGYAVRGKLLELETLAACDATMAPTTKAILESIVHFHELGINPAFHNLQLGTNLSNLALQVAIDELCQLELITWEIDIALSIEHQETITVASLTPKGRAYAIEAQRKAT